MRRALPCLALVAACGFPPLDAGGPDGGGSSCAAPPSYGSPSETGQMAAFNAATMTLPEELDQIGQINGASPGDFVQISLVAHTTEFPGDHVGTGTFMLGAPNFMTCGTCVLLYVKCTNCYSGMPSIAATYMASSGTLVIDSATPMHISGKLTNAKFAHVTIASDGTTTVADSCTTQVASTNFDATVP